MRESNPIAFYLTDQTDGSSSTVDTRIAGGLRPLAVCSLFDDILQQITFRQRGNEIMRVLTKTYRWLKRRDVVSKAITVRRMKVCGGR